MLAVARLMRFYDMVKCIDILIITFEGRIFNGTTSAQIVRLSMDLEMLSGRTRKMADSMPRTEVEVS